MVKTLIASFRKRGQKTPLFSIFVEFPTASRLFRANIIIKRGFSPIEWRIAIRDVSINDH